MITYSDARIDQIIAEDIPYLDLTTRALGLADEPGEKTCFTREACVLAGSEVAERVAERLGCTVTSSTPSGTHVEAGGDFMTVRGTALQLHQAWKVCLNLFDHLSGIATKTRVMVDATHAVNPACEVLTTRKSMPGVKDLLLDAVTAGGAFPHRLGLSETVPVFDHHLAFMGGLDAFIEQLPAIRPRCVEKKPFVEVSAEQALKLAWHNAASTRACAASDGSTAWCGVGGVQVDKLPADELAQLVYQLRSLDPRLTIIAADGNVALGVAMMLLAATTIIFGGLTLARFASRSRGRGGLIAYAEEFLGPRCAAFIGWNFAFLYMPVVCAVLSWVVGVYACMTFGLPGTFAWQMGIGVAFLLACAPRQACSGCSQTETSPRSWWP